MEYLIRHGELYRRRGQQASGEPLASIHSTLNGPRKEILVAGETQAYRTDVYRDARGAGGHRYELCAPTGRVMALGLPGYAPDDDPAAHGWPVNRMPRAEHLSLQLGAETYLLHQLDNGHYQLNSPDGRQALTVAHRGLSGGWDLACSATFSPALLCAVLVFCLYLDRENEFLTV